ncbi:extracellular solute-binding protein [Paenibacillus caseinilyticus]|uniref:ABC transporter substrate-binding protein n=1 Tax=Paenibacillus mucilaginosus K02 TaxID=997761 RepID=I0BDE9_9BACL|nr:extracellular solute-binding protein [Paenibacillus mucilaginosus]AFH60396.1 ABC transporter substrate-binding protein [Paenibacillus mucilaginosus K02]
MGAGQRWAAGLTACCTMLLAGCSGEERGSGTESGTADRFPITIAAAQVGDALADGNDVERAIEAYTGTQLDIQWIPSAAYDDKVSVLIASGKLPMMLRLKSTPPSARAIQSGLFWEIGPYLPSYPNLSALSPQYYDNIRVDGKLYGVPLFRDIARSAVVYRKDWLEKLGMSLPVTAEQWYEVCRAMALGDPDGNGRDDTYGLILGKKYSDGSAATTTRIAVSLGAPNKWGVDEQGQFTPEFMTEPYLDVLRLLRRLYEEKLVNRDFAVLDDDEAEKQYDTGRGGLRVGVAQNAKGMQDRLTGSGIKGEYDLAPMTGPSGVRATAEPGNNGFYVFPKSSVKSEEELKKILGFIDKMLDEEMATLQLRGLEGRHFIRTEGGAAEYKDFELFQKEVKPYRDTFFNLEGYKGVPLKDTPLGEKGKRIPKESLASAVRNPAAGLESRTYTERGRELEERIGDAQTKFIMGRIDEAGWQAEVQAWLKAGGEQMIREYEEAYRKASSAR